MMTNKFKRYFWLALLAHLLLFLSFSLVVNLEPMLAFEKKSDRYLPVYLYQQQSAAQTPSPAQPPQPQSQQPPPEPQKENPDALALKKQPPPKPQPVSARRTKSRSSAAFIEAESIKTGKPIDEPLLKELSRATAEKLFYPPEAAAYHIKGMVSISFLLYPDGRVEEVTIAQSSGFRVLDQAAYNTIRSISPVRDANLYLTKPKYMLAGIIFG